MAYCAARMPRGSVSGEIIAGVVGLLATLTALVAPDSTLTAELRVVPSDVRFAYVEAGAFEEILLDSTALEVRAGSDGITGGLQLAFEDTTGTTLGTLGGTLRLPGFRRIGRPLANEPLEVTLAGKVSDLSFAEAFSPEIDSLAGELGSAQHLDGSDELVEIDVQHPHRSASGRALVGVVRLRRASHRSCGQHCRRLPVGPVPWRMPAGGRF